MAETRKDSGSITIRKDSLWRYSTFILLAIVVIGGIVLFVNNDSSSGTGSGRVTAPTGTGATGGVVEVSEDDDAFLGNSDAPVVLIEFSDFQCPFCRKFWTETFSSIKSDYIDTGKVKFVYRDFPLDSIHPSARPAAIAAECAREVGGSDEAFFKMHDKIFAEQNVLDSGSPEGPVGGTVSFSADNLKSWAKEIGYNIDSCLDSKKYDSEVEADLNDGISYGVQGTPGFFVNGKAISGAVPYSVFKQAFDAEL